MVELATAVSETKSTSTIRVDKQTTCHTCNNITGSILYKNEY